SAARSLVTDDGLDPGRVHVVGCGRNIEPTASVTHDWTTPRFLFVGNDWRRKNGDGVVRAFRQLRETVPSARLDVAGVHPRLDVDGVAVHGPLRLDRSGDRERLADLFAGATCLVMPSFSEPFGIVYVEAASFGIPSIAGNVGGTSTSVGAGGVLVDPTDDAAIVGAMRWLADPAVAAETGALAARRADQFTWRKVAERLVRAAGVAVPGGRELAGFIEADTAGVDLEDMQP
ncbi:MAG: glycosyltransferase family 4 protein, partial [Acidimicrobiales bacterium]